MLRERSWRTSGQRCHQRLWSRWSPAELATPEAWVADPGLVWSWYLWRARQVRQLRPNAGHRALARWAEHARVDVVTQNVDDLHERIEGIRKLLESKL